MATKVNLTAAMFGDSEQLLVEHGSLTASAFRYSTGVAALRLKNDESDQDLHV